MNKLALITFNVMPESYDLWRVYVYGVPSQPKFCTLSISTIFNSLTYILHIVATNRQCVMIHRQEICSCLLTW